MKDVAELLLSMLEHEEERSTALAQACDKSAELCSHAAEIFAKGDLEENASELADVFKQIAEFQKKGAAFHLGEGMYNNQIKRDLALMTNRQGYNQFQVVSTKTTEDELSKLQPTMIQTIIGPAPEPELRAVRRAGQPELPQKPNVDVRFEHLVKVEE